VRVAGDEVERRQVAAFGDADVVAGNLRREAARYEREILDFRGMFGPGRESSSYLAPVISRSCSTLVARVRFAAMTAAAAWSFAAFASSTSVMAMSPTSKRLLACSS